MVVRMRNGAFIGKWALPFLVAGIFFLCGAGSAPASEEQLQKAAAEFKAKNFLKAKDLYREAYLSAKSGALADRALFGLAQAEYLLKNYSEAALNLRRYAANKNAAQRDEALFMLGSSLFFLNKLSEAERVLATVGGEFTDKATITRAEIALQNRQFGLAETLFSRVDRKLLETDNRAIYVEAMLLARKGQGNQAIATVDRIPAAALRNEDLRVERAVVYLLAGRATEAVGMLKSFLQAPLSGMEQVRARRALFQAYEQLGNAGEMVKVGTELLQFDANDDLRRRVIAAYDKLGDVENALKQASQLRDRGLKSLEIEKRLRKVLEADSPQAADLVQRFAMYLHSESPVLSQSAVYLARKGKKSEGRALLQRAVKGSSPSDASLALAEIYVQEGRYDDAKKLLQPLVTHKQFGQGALLMLGEIAERKGDAKGAIELLQKTVKPGKSGKQPHIDSRLGDLYWQTGDKASAIKHYTAAADGGDVDAMIKVADAQYLGGQYRIAEKYYKKALDKDPKDAGQKQWLQYQYGKLTNKREYIEKAAAGGGEIGEAARMYLDR